MAVASLFKVTTSAQSPLDGSRATDGQTTTVSEFLTVQALTNFAAVAGSITLAWRALQALSPGVFDSLLVPFGFAFAFGLVSLATSTDGFKKDGRFNWGNSLAVVFVAVINSLVLASAVVGASKATT